MMDSQFREDFERLVAHAVERGIDRRSQYRGFSPAEVDEVEREWGYPLPIAYRDFLLVMGRHTGHAFEYVTMSFDGSAALLEFQKRARELCAEDDPLREIPAAAFFCSNYLDSQLSYFDAILGEDDPRLFDFELGNPEPATSNYILSSYIRSVFGPTE